MEKLHNINKSTNTSICSMEHNQKHKSIQPSTNIQFLESDDDQTATQAHDIANTLAGKFQENSNNINSPHPTAIYNNIHHDMIRNDNNSSLNSPLTLKEINSILTSTKNSAPAPDNIPNSLVKVLPKTGINYMLKIFNCIWIHKVFPGNWQKAIAVPIPKPNKCKQNPNSYRPIALTNTMQTTRKNRKP